MAKPDGADRRAGRMKGVFLLLWLRRAFLRIFPALPFCGGAFLLRRQGNGIERRIQNGVFGFLALFSIEYAFGAGRTRYREAFWNS